MKLTFCIILLSVGCMAQENKKVMEPVNALFDGMKAGDSAMVHNAFLPEARMFTVYTDSKTNQQALRGSDVQKFLIAIGSPHKEPFNELIWSPKIEIDGNLAQVWVPYAFYLGKTFHHCGIDAFQLFKDAAGNWKIFSLADTRQTVGCVIPKEVSSKMQ